MKRRDTDKIFLSQVTICRRHKKETNLLLMGLFLSMCFSGFFSTTVFADVSGDLKGFFGSLGYNGNVTAPSIYQAQAAGYYSGGSVFLRNRVKNIQVMHVDLPSIRSGCGGIDLFNGGFSFVNTQALTEFFQNIMNNASGYMFNLALETAVPEIAHSMQYIQDIARKVNDSNFNSCETAETLVGGMWPRMRATQQHICKDVGSHNNIFSDWADARQGCSEVGKYKESMDKASRDAGYQKSLIFNKNLIWDAIKNSEFLYEYSSISKLAKLKDKKLAEFFMSLSGTIIYREDGEAAVYSPLAKDPRVIKALLEGGKAKIYLCDEPEKCLKPYESEVEIDKENALYAKISKAINEIVIALKGEGKNSQGLSAELKNFLELTKLPILKFISTQLMSNNAVMAMNINNYSEAIAKTLLMQYLHEILLLVENSLSGTDYAPEIHKQLVEQIHNALSHVEKIKAESKNDIQELMMFIESSKKTEKEIVSRMSGQLKNRIGGA